MLSSGRGYARSVLFYIVAYVLPAAIVWGILGFVLQPLGKVPWIPLIASVYALGFGVCEVLGFPLWPPDSKWQVPSQWLEEHSAVVQTLIWGLSLGPGLLTRNPYAGMWLLPFLLTLSHDRLTATGVGIAIGIAHGGARALGILNNRKNLGASCTPYVVLTQWRWRLADGLALLLAAGGLMVYIVSLLGHNP